MQKRDIKLKNESKLVVKVISIGLTVWLTSFVLILTFAFFELGHIPINGIDYPLDSIIFETLRWVILIATIFGFIFTPFWFLILFNIFINNIKLNHGELILHFIGLFAVGLFFLFKFIWSSQFLWVYD